MVSYRWMCNESSGILIIFVWFLSSMSSLMNYKARNLTKGFVTHVTFVRLLSSMNSLVTSKVGILSKALATNITFIWFLSSINSPMNYICTLTKGLPHTSHLYGFSPVDRQSAWWTMDGGSWHVQEIGIKTIPRKKKCKKSKRLSGEALQIAVEEKQKQRWKGKI